MALGIWVFSYMVGMKHNYSVVQFETKDIYFIKKSDKQTKENIVLFLYSGQYALLVLSIA